MISLLEKKMNLKKNKSNIKPWTEYEQKVKKCRKSVKIAMIGKYVDLEDLYKSLNEALYHAGIINNMLKVNIEYIDSESIKKID